MVLFQPPSRTRFDLRFTLARIPVRVHPLFWVMGLILGSASRDFMDMLVWVVVVFVSILTHEMGHALTMRHYGQAAEVVLYLGGGLAVPQSEQNGRGESRIWLTLKQRILISLAGPGAGFLLAALVMIAVLALGGIVFYTPIFGIIPSVTPFLPGGSGLTYSVVTALLWINIFWSVINLVPVQPLDGGNIAHEYITGADPMNGERKALWISVIGAVVVVAVGLLMQSVYVILLFLFLANQSYEKLKGRVGIH
jgi:stage IV sporulation protein FB